MEDFKIVKLEDQHFSLLPPLYKKAFQKEVSETFLKSKFNTEKVCGIKNVGFLAINDKGDAIAFYGVLPCYVKCNGKIELVAQSGDTMVDPEYRRKKLFVKLGNQTNLYCEQIGIKAVFGFPNIFSFPSFVKKLGWSHYHNIIAYHNKVKCLPFLRISKFVGEDLISKYQDWFLKKREIKRTEYNSFLDEKSVVTVQKGKDYLNYKQYGANYYLRINDVFVWVKKSPMYLYIGDISNCSEEQLELVVVKLQKLAFWLGIPHLRVQSSIDSRLIKAVSDTFEKLENEYPFGGITFTEDIDLSKFRLTLADYDTF